MPTQVSNTRAKAPKRPTRKQAKKAGPNRSVPKPKQTGLKPIAPLPSASQQTLMASGFTNPTSAMNEVVFEVNDYFDLDTSKQTTYYFDMKSNNILDQGVDSPNNIRVLSACFKCLPRFNTETDKASIMVLYAAPAQYVARVAASSDSTAVTQYQAIGQKSTLLTPTSVSDWVVVGNWYEKLFDMTQYSPAYKESEAASLGVNLGNIAAVDPDTFDLETTGRKVQCHVRIRYAATVSPVYDAAAMVTQGIQLDFNSMPTYTPASTSVTFQPHHITNIS